MIRKLFVIGLLGLGLSLNACGDNRSARQVAEDNSETVVTLTPKEQNNVNAWAGAEYAKTLDVGNDKKSGALQSCEGVDSDKNGFVSCWGVMPDLNTDTNQVILKKVKIFVNFKNGTISYKNPTVTRQ